MFSSIDKQILEEFERSVLNTIERSIWKLLNKGFIMTEIAKELNIPLRTVYWHWGKVVKKGKVYFK